MNKEMARKDSGIWTEKRVWKDSFRFSLSFQMIALVLLLLFVCTILVRVYAGVMTTSLKAEALNKGVQLCRNAGEIFTERGDLKETVVVLGGTESKDQNHALLYFDRDMRCVEAAEGWISLDLKMAAPKAGQKGLKTCKMTVIRDGDSIYDVSVQTFVPEKGA